MDTVRQRGEIIPREQRDTVSQRYKRITKAINLEFWGSNSETEVNCDGSVYHVFIYCRYNGRWVFGYAGGW